MQFDRNKEDFHMTNSCQATACYYFQIDRHIPDARKPGQSDSRSAQCVNWAIGRRQKIRQAEDWPCLTSAIDFEHLEIEPCIGSSGLVELDEVSEERGYFGLKNFEIFDLVAPRGGPPREIVRRRPKWEIRDSQRLEPGTGVRLQCCTNL